MNFTRLSLVALILFSMESCQPEKNESTPVAMPKDPHSYSIPTDARVTHLSWKADIHVDTKTIDAVATWNIEKSEGADLLTLDIKGLTIKEVFLDNNQKTEFRLSEKDPILGQALAILIKPETKRVAVHYSVPADAEAIQWLSPQQTAGKKYPFMFTQSQAILARTWVPCQDSPSIRFTYDADVKVPNTLLAMMSASNPQEKNEKGEYHFEMKQPIASYLLALTVGDVAFKPISDRAGIYAEPSVVEKAAWEFADLEKMIAGAESLYGKYQWERYDLIVLPPSFPFGGMENPRLTFATPTILAGDRSLTSLVAHELAHSWSGNLVTNATWDDFWLNEGFTVYFEHRIMEKLYGHDYSEMQATLALQDLKETIADLKGDNLSKDTKLKLDLVGRNPDDGVTDIAYNKGYFFLRLIEEQYGREKFDAFLNNYFHDNAFKSLDTDGFIKYIKDYYQTKNNISLSDSLFNEWIFSEDLPASCPQPVSTLLEKVDAALSQWKADGRFNPTAAAQWSTHEWLHFIKNLPDALSAEQMAALDAFGKFTESGNAEILCAWFVHVIKHNYKKAYPRMEEFLINTGRRKFLSPLYGELVKTPEGKQYAKDIYAKARPNYHFVATNTFDKLLN
ncbi:M1 family metallopeptidase [Pseudochryseolinea flava]|nr:M1 family metallopeptidase [Pseudochryseolinea flava]